MDTETLITSASAVFAANTVSLSTSLTITIQYPIPTELDCFIEITIPSDIPVDQSKIQNY